ANDLSLADHVVEASLQVPTGRIAIDGCTNFRPERDPLRNPNRPPQARVSPHVSVRPGAYRVRIYYGTSDLAPVVDETPTSEHYLLVFWPAPYAEPVVLRQTSRQR